MIGRTLPHHRIEAELGAGGMEVPVTDGTEAWLREHTEGQWFGGALAVVSAGCRNQGAR